jgi:hypothetical protein
MESLGFLLEKRYAMVIDRLFIKSLDLRKRLVVKILLDLRKSLNLRKSLVRRIVFNCKILFNSKKIFRLMAGGRPH